MSVTVRAAPGRLLLLCLIAYILWPYWSGAGLAFAGRRESNDALDFAVFYSAGRIVADGQGSRLYDEEPLATLEHRVIQLPPVTSPQYLNPPFFAAAVAPLTVVSFSDAYQAWTVISVVLLAFVCWLMWGMASPLPMLARLALVLSIGLMPQVATALQLGQFSIALLASWMLAYALLRDGREQLAGLVLFPLLIKPELLLVAAAFLLLTHRYRAFSTLAPLCALALTASIAIVGVRSAVSYPGHLHDSASHFLPGTNSPQKMFGLTGILGATFGPEGAGWQTIIAMPLSVAVLGAAMIAWRRTPTSRGERFPIQWLVVTAAALLADPHLYFQDTMLLFPAIAACVPALSRPYPVWVIPSLAACWLIGAMGQSPNVNAHVCAFGLFTFALLGFLVAPGAAAVARREQPRRSEVREIAA